MPTRKPGAGGVQPILDLIPNSATTQGFFNNFIQFGLGSGQPVDARTIGDIVVNGFRKRVWFLKNHAHLGPQLHRIDTFVIDVFTVQQDRALNAANVDRVVHPVDTAKKRRFPTPRRPDERRHGLVLDRHIHIFDRVGVAIINLHALGRYLQVLFGHFCLDKWGIVHVHVLITTAAQIGVEE